jgi:hypothetical protein
MKKLQRFCATAVLTLILALSVFAGEMGSPGVSGPGPQSCATIGEMGSPGHIAPGDMPGPGVAVLDPVTEAALVLLKSLLSLF